jgi:hypothetical protein
LLRRRHERLHASRAQHVHRKLPWLSAERGAGAARNDEVDGTYMYIDQADECFGYATGLLYTTSFGKSERASYL